MEDLSSAIVSLSEAIIVPLATTYQQSFAAHALSGDPNDLKTRRAATWDVATDDGDTIDDALKASLISTNDVPFFSIGHNLESTSTNCDFWTKVAAGINILYEARRKSDVNSNGSGGLFGL